MARRLGRARRQDSSPESRTEVQVRSLTAVLPDIDVVEGDAFNSSPTDPGLMGPDALSRFRAGETLPSVLKSTPLVELPLGATEDRICGAQPTCSQRRLGASLHGSFAGSAQCGALQLAAEVGSVAF